MNRLKYLSFLVVFVFLASVPNSLAVSFTIIVSPTSTNASPPSVELAFTINNLNASNSITQTNITIPSGFSFLSSNPSSTQSGQTVIFNYNITPNSSSSYNITVSISVIGSYNFTISTIDSGSSIITNTTNNITITDVNLPTYTANSTTPVSDTKYSPNVTYYFNISWNDNVALDDVLFNWNGSATNDTISAYQTGKYSVAKFALSAGNYTYQWYANDTSNLFNTTGVLSFAIAKADNLVNLTLNGVNNTDLSIFVGTTISVTGGGIGSLTRITNLTGSNVTTTGLSSGFTESYTPEIGKYFITLNASGNENYTSNSTTLIITVFQIPPRWSNNVTSVSSVYSPSISVFNVTWTDDNDPNAFNVSLIEMNITSTAVSYTMFRINNTNISSFNTTVPAGTFYWKVYANNSYGSTNSTPMFNFTVLRATLPLFLSIIPEWNVLTNTGTNVSCTSTTSGITVALYRNNTSVSNPDVITLSDGTYYYYCNASGNANYSSTSTSNYLTISQKEYNLRINASTMISIEQGSSTSIVVIVKNTGTVSQSVNFSITGINSSLYTLNDTSRTVVPGVPFPILVTFNIGNIDIKDYLGTFRAVSSNTIATLNFSLRVLPNAESRLSIKNTFLSYKTETLELGEQINSTKQSGANTTAIESNYTELKQKISEIETYINSSDYFNAKQKLTEAESLINSITTGLASIVVPGTFKFPLTSISFPIYYILIPIAAGVAIFLAYLLWPTKGFAPQKYKYAELNLSGKIKEFVEKIKENIMRIFRKGESKKLTTT